MAEPWIRVHANLIDKPVVTRAVETLRVKDHHAVGLLVTFWGSVSRHVPGGCVGDATDAQLEKWARWTGKRGAFAKFIREFHLDADGRPNEWDDYNGALEHRRANERERKARERARMSRGQSAGSHADITRTGGVTVQPARAVRNETIRDTTTTPPPPRARDAADFDAPEPPTDLDTTWTPPSEVAAAESRIAERLATDADRTALTVLVSKVPSPLTWLAEIAASLDAMAGHPTTTPAQCGEAIREFVGNGALAEPNLRRFRRYLGQAAVQSDAAERAPPTNGTTSPTDRRAMQSGARNDAAIDSTLEYLEAKYGN